jgi:protein-disulfide isomerase
MNERQATRDDHIRGNGDAPVMLIEYADFQCPYSARAYAVLGDLRDQLGDDLCLVYRHLPLTHLHPYAEPAAEASEAAAAQGKFWEMHDALYENQDLLDPGALPALAESIELDSDRFRDDLLARRFKPRVLHDAERGKQDGADQTPTFFINGQRYYGDSDYESLSAAIQDALNGPGRAS